MLKLSKNNADKLYYSVSPQPHAVSAQLFSILLPRYIGAWSLASVELEPLLFNLVVFLS